MESSQEEGKIRVNGVELHYEKKGSGPAPILCIPGAMGTVDEFRPQLEYFGREGSGYTIVSFDPRGYGQSRPAKRFEKGTNFFHTDVKDAHALMQALSFPKYSVIGWSDGAIESLIIAALYPDAVQKVVAVAGNAYVSDHDVELYEKYKDVDSFGEEMSSALKKVYGDSLQELWSSWIAALMEFKTEKGGDICTKELSQIACPALIVQGAKDPFIPSFHAEYIKDRVSGSKLEIFEEGDHSPHLQFPQKFNKLVEQFLRQ